MFTRKKFTRQEILERLYKTIEKKKPIIGAGCSAGIIAKSAEIGGADMIIVYSSGKSRIMGLSTTLLGDSNKLTLEMADEILNVVENTPVVAGIQATDPTNRDLSLLIERFMAKGFHGIINYSTVGMDLRYRRLRDHTEMGFSREIDMIKLAHEMDIFTMVYTFNPEDTMRMVEAGTDVVVAHVGPTAGGLTGFKSVALEKACEIINEIISAAKSIRSDVICIAHGGAMYCPENTKYIYGHTDAAGHVGASSIERISVENAIIDVVRKYKGIKIK